MLENGEAVMLLLASFTWTTPRGPGCLFLLVIAAEDCSVLPTVVTLVTVYRLPVSNLLKSVILPDLKSISVESFILKGNRDSGWYEHHGSPDEGFFCSTKIFLTLHKLYLAPQVSFSEQQSHPCVTEQTEILPFLANGGDVLKASRWAVSIWTSPSVLVNHCMQIFFTSHPVSEYLYLFLSKRWGEDALSVCGDQLMDEEQTHWSVYSASDALEPLSPSGACWDHDSWLQCTQLLSYVPIFETSWTVAHEALLSMEFSRQEYWSGLPFPTSGDLPDPGFKSLSPASPALAGRFFTTEPPGKVWAMTVLSTKRWKCF